MTKFQTKTTEVDAYEFDGSLRSAAEIAMTLDAIELKFDKNALASETRPAGPRATIIGDFVGWVTLAEGDWVVRLPDGQILSYSAEEFIEQYEEKRVAAVREKTDPSG